MKLEKVILIAVMLFTCLNAHAQTCRDNIIPNTPDSRFTDNGDGTVKDKQTGLIWMRCALGQTWDGVTCTGEATQFTWQQALQAADGYSFAGSDAWRVPNSNELESIVERACYDPVINLGIFPTTLSSGYWTSSPRAYYYNDHAWHVNFYYGYGSSSAKNNSEYVRLVRSDSD